MTNVFEMELLTLSTKSRRSQVGDKFEFYLEKRDYRGFLLFYIYVHVYSCINSSNFDWKVDIFVNSKFYIYFSSKNWVWITRSKRELVNIHTCVVYIFVQTYFSAYKCSYKVIRATHYALHNICTQLLCVNDAVVAEKLKKLCNKLRK